MAVDEWVAKIEVKASKLSPRGIQNAYYFGRAFVIFGYILGAVTLGVWFWDLAYEEAEFLGAADFALGAAMMALNILLGLYLKTFAAACLVLKTRYVSGHALPETG